MLLSLLLVASAAGSTLHDAAARGDAALVRRLLTKSKTPVDLQVSDGSTALMVAAAFGYNAVVEELLRHHADTGAYCRATWFSLPLYAPTDDTSHSPPPFFVLQRGSTKPA